MNESRRGNRVPMTCDVEFRRHGDARYKVEVIDLSPEGCCISPPVRIEQGESVWLRLPGMEAIHAKVAWVRDWKAGIEFDRPFYPSVFELVVKKLKDSSGS